MTSVVKYSAFLTFSLSANIPRATTSRCQQVVPAFLIRKPCRKFCQLTKNHVRPSSFPTTIPVSLTFAKPLQKAARKQLIAQCSPHERRMPTVSSTLMCELMRSATMRGKNKAAKVLSPTYLPGLCLLPFQKGGEKHDCQMAVSFGARK